MKAAIILIVLMIGIAKVLYGLLKCNEDVLVIGLAVCMGFAAYGIDDLICRM